MFHKYLSLILLAFLVTTSFGQNKPVPAYVTQQDFPDSVLNIPVVKLDGSAGTFGDMLKSVRGRKIVLDIWASWCRDCIVGLPKLEKLKEKTDSDEVVYVFLSIDENEAKWRGAIDRFFRIEGEHYRIPIGWKNALSNYIVLDWVPRYLTLDEAGRIIMPKAIEAGESQLMKSLR